MNGMSEEATHCSNCGYEREDSAPEECPRCGEEKWETDEEWDR